LEDDIIEKMKEKVNLEAISIILIRPKFPENVGSVARAMKNTGLSRLTLVGGCSALHMNAYKLASGAEDILERAEEWSSMDEALEGQDCLVGTTSREGRGRVPLLRPNDLVARLVPVSQKSSIALIFGPEKDGLTNEELSRCHLYVRIPSAMSFPSFNLSHAVAIICHELFNASAPGPKRPVQLAGAGQMEDMFRQMEKTLADIGFLDSRHPKRIMTALRSLFGRSQMEERDVQILRGIWSQVGWYTRRQLDLRKRGPSGSE
jgi:tRNA/rRNA methyltransferase